MKKSKRPGLGRFVLGAFTKPAKKSAPAVRRKKAKPARRPERWIAAAVGIETAPTTALAPIVQPAPQPIAPPVPQVRLSTSKIQLEEFLRPEGELRRSIEAFLLDQRSEHTRRAYGKDLKRFVKFLHLRKLSAAPATALDRGIVIAYKEFLLSEKLEHTTVDRHLATLRSFFRWLVEDGLIEKSPAEGVRFLSPKRISPTIGFSDEEVRKVLEQPNLHRRTGALHYAVLMVLFFCGLRRSELCSLKVGSLGEERGHRVIRLRGKGNAERVLVVRPEVWNAIRYYFMISARGFSEKEAPLFMPVRNPHEKVAGARKALDPSMVFYIVTRYAKLAGIANRVSPHSCRATAISNARDRNVPDRAIQEFAGWASPDMITRYDKRRTSVEDSAAHAINYGFEERVGDKPVDSEPRPAGAGSAPPDPEANA